MDHGGGVFNTQLPQQQQQSQQQQQQQHQGHQQKQFIDSGVVARQRPPPPAPPTRRSYPSTTTTTTSGNTKLYPSITITCPPTVKHRSPSPRGLELLAAVNEIHEQMKRRGSKEVEDSGEEEEEKEETEEDEFHENELKPCSAGQRA